MHFFFKKKHLRVYQTVTKNNRLLLTDFLYILYIYINIFVENKQTERLLILLYLEKKKRIVMM